MTSATARARTMLASVTFCLLIVGMLGAGSARAADVDDLPQLDAKLEASIEAAMSSARQIAAAPAANADAVATAWRGAGVAASHAYALSEMQTAFDAAVAADAQSTGPNSAYLLDDLHLAADAYAQAGLYDQAKVRLEREITAGRANGSRDSFALAAALRLAGQIDLLQGNVNSARSRLAEARRLDSAAPALLRPALLQADDDLAGDIALATQRLTLAISYYQAALQQSTPSAGDIRAATGLVNVSSVMRAVRQSSVLPTIKAEYPTYLAVREDQKLGRRSQAEHDALDWAIASEPVMGHGASSAQLQKLVANCQALGIGSSATALEAYLALGQRLAHDGKLDEAIDAVRSAQRIGVRSLGQQYLARGTVSGVLARLELVKHDFTAAGTDATDAIVNDLAVGADSGPLGAHHLAILAIASEAAGKTYDAYAAYNDLVLAEWAILSGHPLELKNRPSPAGNAIPSISGEEERLKYADVAAEADGFAERFALRLDPEHGGLLMYRIASHTKGVIAKSIGGLLARAEQWAPTDPAVSRALRTMLASRELLSQMELNEPALENGVEFEYFQNVYAVRDQVSEAETQLYASLAAHGASGIPQSPAPWTSVKAKLRPKEAAVEYLRIPAPPFERDADSDYVAVVITHDSTAPAVVRLGPEKPIRAACEADFACRALGSADSQAAVGTSGSSLYAKIWRPLEPVLANSQRVYIAPDGVLSNVSFAALRRETGEYLIDGSGSRALDIREVTSTEDILKPDPIRNATAVFVADPDFEVPLDQIPDSPAPTSPVALASSNVSADPLTQSGEPPTPKHLDALPETLDQVRTIGALLDKQGWRTSAYTGSNASKGALFAARGPGVLHIATHGYYLGDFDATAVRSRPVVLDSSLMRSLLFFAGAGGTWERHRPSFTIDEKKNVHFRDTGILTAYEAAALDLRGTQLVVLSACETGQGSVAGSEGVIGMMRTLEEAGARAVLMTLWDVPTAETTELLGSFYANWMSGEDEYTALRHAQRQLRDQIVKREGHDDPNAWAGFVVVAGY